jgi:CheY-like chemotaxis protein
VINSPKVLLVDDSRTNLEVLAGFLSGFEFKLLFASNGERALQVAGHAVPDLILLDILLPGIDGYETCRRLKADEVLAQIPVLFLSALDDVSDKVKGFEAGAVDYLSKPFQKEELIARVRTHLELYRIRRENRRYALEMERLAQERARALIHADRLSTLGTLSAGVAHEINNPATFISVGIQTFARLWPRLDSLLDQAAGLTPDESGPIAFARAHVPEIISNVKSGVMRIRQGPLRHRPLHRPGAGAVRQPAQRPDGRGGERPAGPAACQR